MPISPLEPIGGSGVCREERTVLLALGWYYPDIHRGVARYASERGWHLTHDFDDPIPTHFRGDGIVTLLGARDDLWPSLKRLKRPVVDLAESRPAIRIPRVTMDNAAIGELAAEHLLDRGYQNFAFVQRWNFGVSKRRGAAYRKHLRSAGRRCRVLSWSDRDEHIVDSRANRHAWLIEQIRSLPKPVAVFCSRDPEAAEVIEACDTLGVRLPADVAVLGVDNTDTICTSLRVPLSSIDANLEMVGYSGAKALDSLMDRRKAEACGSNTTTYIAPRGVVVRQSTDADAVPHPAVAAALRYLRQNFGSSIRSDEIADHVAMSRSGLEKAFRDSGRESPIHELRKIRVTAARRALVASDTTLQAIALQCGFETPQNFSRVFRSEVGCTPSEYRASAARPLK